MNSSQIANLPGIKWAMRHPRVAAWIVLSIGMVVLLIIEARDVGLLATQWVALVAACVLVAGTCVWIISWEDEDEIDTPADAALDEKSEDQSST